MKSKTKPAKRPAPKVMKAKMPKMTKSAMKYEKKEKKMGMD